MVKKACQKDRDQRYQSCEEWLEDLLAIQTGSSTVGQIPPLKPEEPVYEKTKIKEPSHRTGKEAVENTQYAVVSPKKNSKNTKKLIIISAVVILVLAIIGLFSDQEEIPVATENANSSENSSSNISDTSTIINSTKSSNSAKIIQDTNQNSQTKTEEINFAEQVWVHSKGNFRRTTNRNNLGEIIWLENDGNFVYYETSYNSTTGSYSVYRKNEAHVKLEIFNTYVYYRDKNNQKGFKVYDGQWLKK